MEVAASGGSAPKRTGCNCPAAVRICTVVPLGSAPWFNWVKTAASFVAPSRERMVVTARVVRITERSAAISNSMLVATSMAASGVTMLPVGRSAIVCAWGVASCPSMGPTTDPAQSASRSSLSYVLDRPCAMLFARVVGAACASGARSGSFNARRNSNICRSAQILRGAGLSAHRIV